MNQILIGCDPELFVYTDKGTPVSAHDLIPGTKVEPHEVDKGAVQVDGVAAEFNIVPAKTEDEFVRNIVRVEAQLLEILHKQNNKLVLRATPTIKFTRRMWEAIPEDAKMLGCEPDFNAYSMGRNPKPHTNKLMRTGSGHIHISWGQNPDEVKRPWMHHVGELVYHLDHHLYPQSLKWDTDEERRELYGQEGAFRPKPYGVEYRVLSNKWVETEKTMRYVYKTALACTTRWLEGYKPGMYEVPAYA